MSIVLIAGNFALTITKSSRVYLFEQAQCLIYYQVNDSTQIDFENGIKESLCKLEGVQYPLSIIVGIDAILAMLPGKVTMSYLFLFLEGDILISLGRSAVCPWCLSAARGQDRPAKSDASELVLLSHGCFSFYCCVYVHFLLFLILRILIRYVCSLVASTLEHARRPDIEHF